uniref:Uncharacterized protein n=1 Tax=Trichobilharzia regenti TaxID=157069 RepID=A0AA85J7I6_TRIRE|nr:unnamed protein product [Trichobilharzia regenti]
MHRTNFHVPCLLLLSTLLFILLEYAPTSKGFSLNGIKPILDRTNNIAGQISQGTQFLSGKINNAGSASIFRRQQFGNQNATRSSDDQRSSKSSSDQSEQQQQQQQSTMVKRRIECQCESELPQAQIPPPRYATFVESANSYGYQPVDVPVVSDGEEYLSVVKRHST